MGRSVRCTHSKFSALGTPANVYDIASVADDDMFGALNFSIWESIGFELTMEWSPDAPNAGSDDTYPFVLAAVTFESEEFGPDGNDIARSLMFLESRVREVLDRWRAESASLEKSR